MRLMPKALRAVTVAAALAVPLGACAPTSGPPTAQDIRAEQAQARGLVADLAAKDKLVKDRALTRYLDGILARIDAQRPPGSVPLQGNIVADADVNAFTTGGGYVFVNAGLLAAMENEAQLAMVLSHEVAHVDRGHIRAGKDARMAAGIGGLVASIGLSALGVSGDLINPVVGLGQSAAVAGYSRGQEEDADVIGLRYLTGAGWNAVEGAGSFEVLRRLYGDNSGFLSSHPSSTGRQRTLVSMARDSGPAGGEVNAQSYLRATAGIRRDVLDALRAQGRDREAAQVSANIRAMR
jgi:predicted Zn-dependent protease